MRIGIDARFYGPQAKGLGRYSEKLIQYLAGLDKKNQYVIFLTKNNFSDFISTSPNFKKVEADYRWYTLAEQIHMPRAIAKEKIDLMHFPHFNVPLLYRGKFIVTIHDLILTHFPTQRASTLGPLKYFIKHRAYKKVISQAIKKSKKIITVSNYTKKEIIDTFKVNPSKIEVTYEACSDFKSTLAHIDKEKFFKEMGIFSPYILYVGNAYPHKNLELLLEAFKDVITEKIDLQLVLVGKMDYFFERLKNLVNRLKLEKKVVFPGYVTDEELKAFYQNAKLYIFPSKVEGFGLPPLEAMAQGLPVVSSSSSSLPEILGNAAYYFNPDKKEEISMAIKEVLANDKLREEMKKNGYNQVKKYNWEKLAEQTLNIYNSLESAQS